MKNHRLLAAMSGLSVLATAAGFFFHCGAGVPQRWERLRQKEVSLREVEVSVWEFDNALNYFMSEPSEMAHAEYAKQIEDVEKFLAVFESSCTDPREVEATRRFRSLWAEARALADHAVQKTRERGSALQAAVRETNAADDILDYKIQTQFLPTMPQVLDRERAVREVEVSIWEALNATALEVSSGQLSQKKEREKQFNDVAVSLRAWEELKLSAEEQQALGDFQTAWKNASDAMTRAGALSNDVSATRLKLWERINDADDVIDFQLQAHMGREAEGLLNGAGRGYLSAAMLGVAALAGMVALVASALRCRT